MTLVELIMFIVVVSVGLAGILAVLTIATKSSADPMIRKNMLSIAEALLEEVQMMPFTYCDPDDANAGTATSTAGCASVVEVQGLEGGESRTSFDNVNDYWVAGGMNLASPVADISGVFSAPGGYSARIEIFAEALNDIASSFATPAVMEALRIAVTVTHGGDSLTLEGYRARHSPNSVP
jgi:MSHA pilin protein MshD